MPVPMINYHVRAKNDRTLDHYGQRGELRAGGRVAARLQAWHYKATKGGWMITAGLYQPDLDLIDHGAEFEVRLVIGNYIHCGADVLVTRKPGSTEEVTIVGTEKLEKIERYGSNSRQAIDQRAVVGVRAIRDVPGGNGGSSGVPGWDPARGRVLVRVDGHRDAPVRRGPLG